MRRRGPAPEPPAEFILPAQAVIFPTPPSGPGWIHEVKADGYRIVAYKGGDRIRLSTRQAVDYTDHFPRIAAAIAGLPVDACVIDGEAVCFAAENFDFHALRSRAGGRGAVMVAFDLIELDGEDLRPQPLEVRRPGARGDRLKAPRKPVSVGQVRRLAEDQKSGVRSRLMEWCEVP